MNANIYSMLHEWIFKSVVHFSRIVWLVVTAEKRQADESLSSVAEEPRKKKIDGDVPSDVVAEILEVTSDPKKMLGPDVCTLYNTCYNVWVKLMLLLTRELVLIKIFASVGSEICRIGPFCFLAGSSFRSLKTDMVLESPWICVWIWRSLKVLEFDFLKRRQEARESYFSCYQKRSVA